MTKEKGQGQGQPMAISTTPVREAKHDAVQRALSRHPNQRPGPQLRLSLRRSRAGPEPASADPVQAARQGKEGM